MKHNHADLMAAYAADAQTTDKPWELWEYRRPCFDSWHGLLTNPQWERACEYRRKENTTPIKYSVSCAMPVQAVSPELAAQKFREAFMRGAVMVQVEDCDGLVHCYLSSGELI